ncbi:Molybdenum transport system permease protein ModB [Vibrio stylophorae]|uniref:Molybdenum transport system permease n=1 Tax=Vibrio stylophorae TaxID=659351 RepID=A0ABM8ZX37_9VIBR|nr:molybdate ABC transporter permease subunit [Vibrio stylophorae]CAH0535218.1 Molybdenum transport system permease protein ModB [Vibrio stylophorae]
MLTAIEYDALRLSLQVALVAVLASLPLGIFLAWLLARFQFWGKNLLDGVIHLPLVLPPVVVGYLLLIGMGQQGVVGQWLWQHLGLSFSFNWQGAALASAVVSLPLMVRAMRQAFEQVDSRFEQAAKTLGASPLRVFFTITLPLMMPGLIAGIVLAFARSLGEFGATITFVANIPQQTQTLPLAIYQYIQTPGGEQAAARLCIISIALSLSSLWLATWLTSRNHRKMERSH